MFILKETAVAKVREFLQGFQLNKNDLALAGANHFNDCGGSCAGGCSGCTGSAK